MARTEVSEATGLSSASVSDLVSELLRRDLLIESKAAATGRGRPRVQLQINSKAAYVAGAFLLPRGELLVEIVDVRGERLFGEVHHLGRPETLDALVLAIASAVEQTIAASPLQKTALHSVGLGLPALVDPQGGVVHWLPGYDRTPVPVAATLGRNLGVPVYIDSSANLLTRAEHWFGADRQVDDFTLIFIGPGIGLGQYVDGLLRAGGHGLTSSFAHVKVTPGEGPMCICGGRGCLMTYASMSGLVRRIAERQRIEPPPFTHLKEAFAGFAEQARAGRSEATDAFAFAGRALGIATANYINAWEPWRIDIAVADPALAELIGPAFHAALQDNTLPALQGLAPVRFRIVEEVNFAKGAAALVLEQLYRAKPATSETPSARPRLEEKH